MKLCGLSWCDAREIFNNTSSYRCPYPELYMIVKGVLLTARENIYGNLRRSAYISELARGSIHKQKTTEILDLGCGTGINISIPLAKAGYRVVGIDLDLPSIQRARQLSEGITNIEFHCLDVRTWYPDQPFDVIVCSEVLEHLNNLLEFMQQVLRLLAPGGCLVVTVPNGYGWFEMEQAVLRIFPRLNTLTDRLQHAWVRRFGGADLKARHEWEWQPENYQREWTTLAKDGGHKQHFTVRRIRKLLESSGFTITNMTGRTFLAGNVLNNLLRDCDQFLEWNARIADRLPLWMCSGWMITARRAGQIT